MEWSPQQDHALISISRWLKSPSSPQVFKLFGYAGTGKTTLIKEIANFISGTVLYMAFTGKAALVMQKKDCYGASTIHSAIYKAIEDQVTGKVEFILNRDSPVSTADLVIVDEVSMVNEDLGMDLLYYGTKILVLGDPFQLPPVGGEGFFTTGTPDVMLTEIHRQAWDNPIIRMSLDIREGNNIRTESYGDSKIIDRRWIEDPRFDTLLSRVDQVICGTNRTRMNLNNRVRKVKGIADPANISEPQVNDKLVCIRNNKQKGLLNGGLWKVESVRKGEYFNMNVSSLDMIDGNTDNVDVRVPHEFFYGAEGTLDWRERKKIDEFTFGEVLTVHKSQGSQWDQVLVIDESPLFGDFSKQHLYTAVTRAAERVYITI